ncbi:SGNH/GDSL hydrolase family protein [Bremerella cremea]|uniref:SGNH/GDSL hydrolase family protein n=1 Tax=Bremerella cremea TaxID=1031537 RepID=UPI0031EFF2EA
MPGHVALLGDSIFDNAAYVPEGKSVIELLKGKLPADCDATLRAVDGARASDVFHQSNAIPKTTTHLVMSIGGNDALWASGELFTDDPAPLAESLRRVATAVDTFAQEYRELILHLLMKELPLAVCTIYDSIPGMGVAERAGLGVYNDVITRTAFRNNLPLIDLRLICDDPGDYSAISPIEPSAQGSEKIAQVIADALMQTGNSRRVFI